MKVVLHKNANKSLDDLSDYLALGLKVPETASKYIAKMRLFANSLKLQHFAYPICNNEKFRKKSWHCATFNKKWVFAYQIKQDKIVIDEIVFGKLLK